MGNILTKAWNYVRGEKRSASVGAEHYSPELARIFGFGYNGKLVNESTALKLSAVYRCVGVISEGVAKVPINVFKRTGTSRNVAYDHPVQYLLHDSPNSYMTSFAFKQAIVAIACLRGNGYARILRGKGQRPDELKLYGPGEVSLVESMGQLYAQTPDGLIPYYDIFHLRGMGFGIEGQSPIRYGAESMTITANAQTFGRKFFENGAHVGGVLEHPGTLSDTAFTHLKNSFDTSHTGLDNVAKPKILEEGMKWNKISLSPDEAQFIQTRQFGTTDICRWFGVPPHKIFDLEKATFSNIEQQSIEFVQDAIMPWCERFEQEANRKLFRESERGTYYTKFNLNALMRGDSNSRATFYESGMKNGWLNANEVRELEDRNPIEGGDRYYVQGNNMVPVDLIDKVLLAKTGKNTPKTQENEKE